jgi:hypothetical protein
MDSGFVHMERVVEEDCGWSLLSHGTAEVKWVDLGILKPTLLVLWHTR